MDLSVIIVSYNSGELLKNCLKSVALAGRDKEISLEVIIVDNGSKDGTAEFLKRDCLAMTVILNKKNVGFGRANNLGAKIAKGRYLLFLNQDTVVKDGALSKMVKFMDENERVGVASCRLVNPDGSFQPQGGYLPRLTTVAAWALFFDDIPVIGEFLPSYQMRSNATLDDISSTRSARDPRSLRRRHPTNEDIKVLSGSSSRVSEMPSSGRLKLDQNFQSGWVGGTAMFIKREAWEELGGFDENIFMYGEDVELCYRAKKAGWRVAINPEAEIVHKGKAGGGKWVTGEVEGLLYIFKKHKPGWEMPILKLILGAGMGLRWLIFGILGGNEDLRRGYAEAVSAVAGRSS